MLLQAITPQLPGLAAAGFDVRCLYLPVADRSSWQGLTRQAVALLHDLLASSPHDQARCRPQASSCNLKR